MSLNTVAAKSCHPCAADGFSLIEVLVALSIMAVGMLGMTALQTKSLQYNQAAFIDSQAQFLIGDIVERIRANRGNNLYGIRFTEPSPTVSVQCDVSACTRNEMALWDLVQWRAMVEDTAYLPEGESEIVFNNLNREFTISIRYDWSQLGGVDLTDGKRTVSLTTRIE